MTCPSLGPLLLELSPVACALIWNRCKEVAQPIVYRACRQWRRSGSKARLAPWFYGPVLSAVCSRSPRTLLCLDIVARLYFFLLFLLWIIFIWWFSTPTRCIEMGKLHSKHGKTSYSREKNHSCSCWVLRYFRVTHSLSLVFLFLFLSPSQKLLFVNRGRVQKVSALIPLHDALKHFLSISVSLWTAEQFPESVSASVYCSTKTPRVFEG